jgi:hypothetical protein
MRSANKEFTFRGPSKLLGFGNADDADIEVNVGRAYAYPNHFVDDICTFGN